MTVPHRLTAAALKRYRNLGQKKTRRASGLCLLEGQRLVGEALASDWTIESVLISEALLGRGTAGELVRTANNRHAPLYRITERELAALSDTVTSQGILAVASRKAFTIPEILDRRGPLLVVALDRVADPGNVGTILRICDWFGADALVLDRESVEICNPKVLRGSMGAIFHVPVVSGLDLPEAIGEMKEKGLAVLCAVPEGGERPESVAMPARSVVVFGNEAHGVSGGVASLVDRKISIPRYGRAESLNVAVACGIVLASVRSRDA